MSNILIKCEMKWQSHGPLTRYAKLRVAHAPGMPGTFSPPLRVSDPDMRHGMCVTPVPWCMPVSLTSAFLWSQWQGKHSRHSRHSRRMCNPQFYVSGKRPIWLENWLCPVCIHAHHSEVTWMSWHIKSLANQLFVQQLDNLLDWQ